MSKDMKIIPELRFPEFRNEGEWEEKALGEIGEVLMCKRVFAEETNPIDGIPFFKIGTFGRVPDAFISPEKYNEFKSKYSFPNVGDILISASGTIGRLVIYDGSPAYFQDSNIVWLGNNEKIVFNSFLFYCYSVLKWQTSDGGIISRLYNSDLKRMKIRIPENKKEQQKIASCLSSLDEVIAAHSQKLELLKDHKKGLMQNLFPTNSITNDQLRITNDDNESRNSKIPELRFPEFRNEGEWEENTIGEVFNSFSGGTPNTSEKEYYGGRIPFIRSAEINREKTELFLTEEGLKNSSAKLVNKDDLLVALYGANSGDSAISKISGAINQAILCLQSEYSNAFTYYFLTLKKEWIISKFIQGGQGNLSGDIVKSINVPFPKKKEQQKIASCLSSLDALITAQAEKIEQLKLHKKGLMQGLFPKIV